MCQHALSIGRVDVYLSVDVVICAITAGFVSPVGLDSARQVQAAAVGRGWKQKSTVVFLERPVVRRFP
jgi:hypothetical protein